MNYDDLKRYKSEKVYMTYIDNPGEKLEIIELSGKVIVVRNEDGFILNVPSVYLVDYSTWLTWKN